MNTKELKFFEVQISRDYWRNEHWFIAVVAKTTREARRLAIAVCVDKGFINKSEIRKTDVIEKYSHVFLDA